MDVPNAVTVITFRRREAHHDGELATALGTADDAVLAQVALVKVKTDLIPADPASTTNITAGTITTVTNLTNAPTNGDLTAVMKTSVTTAATAATPIAASVTGAVGSVTGIGGMFGSLGGILLSLLVQKKLFVYYRSMDQIETAYYIMFVVCGLAYLSAWLFMHLLAPKMDRVK
jgi:nitrate/nitrite transporter NarK